MRVTVFILLSIYRGIYTAAGDVVTISSGDDLSDENKLMQATSNDYGNKKSVISSTSLSQISTVKDELCLPSDINVLSQTHYLPASETLISSILERASYKEDRKECSIPTCSYFLTEQRPLFQEQNDTDSYLVGANNTHYCNPHSSNCSGSVNPDACAQTSGITQPSNSLRHDKPVDLNEVSCNDNNMCDIATFIQCMEQKLFYNISCPYSDFISLNQPNFTREIFQWHENAVCKTSFDKLFLRHHKKLNKALDNQQKTFLLIDTCSISRILDIKLPQSSDKHFFKASVAKFQASWLIFLLESRKYFNNTFLKCKDLHVTLQRIETIIKQALKMNIKLNNTELMASLIQLDNEQSALFNAFIAHISAENDLFMKIFVNMRIVFSSLNENVRDNLNVMDEMNKIRKYVYDDVLDILIIPRMSNAISFGKSLVLSVKNNVEQQNSIGYSNNDVVLINKGTDTTELCTTMTVNEHEIQTSKVIMSYMDEYKKLVSLICTLNEICEHLNTILNHDLNFIEQIVNNLAQ
ncbi:hypothetical protein THOM_1871 [Trachipleistophora hominis]|uniref:Uncharacterized protein n=1 Tax=Trachipleistophora hominis TaxID=72359 RepID=L7JWU2_TRAHO|nr:hypothetical protein THOM_1871 [Trachipleistophora hominis]